MDYKRKYESFKDLDRSNGKDADHKGGDRRERVRERSLEDAREERGRDMERERDREKYRTSNRKRDERKEKYGERENEREYKNGGKRQRTYERSSHDYHEAEFNRYTCNPPPQKKTPSLPSLFLIIVILLSFLGIGDTEGAKRPLQGGAETKKRYVHLSLFMVLLLFALFSLCLP